MRIPKREEGRNGLKVGDGFWVETNAEPARVPFDVQQGKSAALKSLRPFVTMPFDHFERLWRQTPLETNRRKDLPQFAHCLFVACEMQVKAL